MPYGEKADAIDNRIVYRVYAGLAGTVGLALWVWGPGWLEDRTLMRTLGSVLMVLGCLAGAMAGVEDPGSRQRGLAWLAAGHVIVFLAVATQVPGELKSADLVAFVFLGIAAALSYMWLTVEGEPETLVSPLTSLFKTDGRNATTRLRSAYERQIREGAKQEERNRLARELHDSVKQQIFAIQTAAATAQVRFVEDRQGAEQALETIRNSAREAMTEMEVMLDQLREAPLENVGLVEGLKRQAEAVGFQTGAEVDFAAGALPASDGLAPGAHQAIFRVAQEALANVARHARAKNVRVRLTTWLNRVLLEVHDDGAGFDPEADRRGMGLANMRRRAEEFDGEFELATRPGNGTTIRFSVPYVLESARRYRRQAAQWGTVVVLYAGMAVVLRHQQLIAVVGITVGIIALLRNLAAWRRIRNQKMGIE